ncbi:MAG: hypothetical protein WAT43_03375 [Chitinophagales bacterium]|nr:hypothetical protein [Bacteroidota bacterium]
MKIIIKLFFLTCFYFIACNYLLAQPGPYGGTFKISVLDADSNVITPKSKDYKVFVSWPESEAEWFHVFSKMPDYYTGKHYQHPITYASSSSKYLYPILQFEKGYYYFSSVPTPGGGLCPTDLMAVVVHGKDTMRIVPSDFRDNDFILDSIAFKKGTYVIDPVLWYAKENFIPLNGSLITPDNIYDFNVENYYSNAVYPKSENKDPEKILDWLIRSNPYNTMSNYFAGDTIIRGQYYKVVYKKTPEGQIPIAMLKNIYSNLQILGDGKKIMLIKTGEEPVIYTSNFDDLKNWVIWPIRDFIDTTEIKNKEFYLKEINFDNGNYIALGSRIFEYNGNYSIPNYYLLYFNPRVDVYNLLKQKSEIQINEYLKRHNIK